GKAGVTVDVRPKSLRDLAAWWHDYFCVTGPGILNGAWAEKTVDPLGIIDSPSALVDRLTGRMSNRDVSAQLFVAVCRSLGMEARLVASLQAISFRARSRVPESDDRAIEQDLGREDASVAGPSASAPSGTPKRPRNVSTSARKRRRTLNETAPGDDACEDAESEAELPGNLGPDELPRKNRKVHADDPGPPVFWAEVWSPQENKWLCVDAVGGRQGTLWRSVGDEMAKALVPDERCAGNVLAYVVACEDDGRIKDVTRRYSRQYASKTKRLRLPVAKNRGDWWEDTIAPFRSREQSVTPVDGRGLFTVLRASDTNTLIDQQPRSRKEDEELDAAESAEAMPKTIAEFNNHTLYALERHLKKFEVLDITAPVLGTIRNEKVYPRSAVRKVRITPVDRAD
ncbi:MAG: hypothetical protein BJ554DRAFT_2708, partial [Olpidium bornovanus]